MKKRKINTKVQGGKNKNTKKSLGGDSFFVESESSGEEEIKSQSESEEDEFADETADEKRIRIAKAYLQKLELDKADLTSDEEIDDPVAHRLQQDILRERGMYQQKVADKVAESKVDESPSVFRGHRLTPTCLALSPSDEKAYTGSKDCSLMQWDIETGKKTVISKGARGRQRTVKGHYDQVLAVAISDDDTYLATAGKDQIIHIWDPRSHELIHKFEGHRSTVTSLAFRKGSHQLFSGGEDRQVKIWNLEQMQYVESLYGHQADVQGIDSLYRDRALSVGLDKTVRSWKVVEETQLLFRGGHDFSIDCVAMVNEDSWVTGGQDGIISLWNANKKKPQQLISRAHDSKWISSVTAVPFTDLVASGSSDGFIKLWKCSDSTTKGEKPLSKIKEIPIKGHINGLKFASDARFIVAAVGNEHRLGRWEPDKSGKNGIQVVQLGKNLMAKRKKVKTIKFGDDPEADAANGRDQDVFAD